MTHDPHRTAERGRLCIGRYEVLGEIAAGGMGRVLLAQLAGDGGFRRLVAVKLPHEHLKHDQAMIDRLLDEARIAAQVRHPHVVSILEIDRSEEHGYFLVMDYVDGLAFSQVLLRLGPPTPQRWAVVCRVVLDALEGVAAAHETLDEYGQPMNIVHRDISPQNILVGVDGTARVTDFGIAKAATRLSMTRTGQTLGKLGYMSPEQLQGGLVEAQSDLFSVGVVLWEAVAGRRLFNMGNDLEALTRALTDPIPTLAQVVPGVPPELSAVAERALQRDPYMRFPDARAMGAALERAAASAGLLARPQDVGAWVRSAFGPEFAARRQWIQLARPANRGVAVDALPAVPGPTTASRAAAAGDDDAATTSVRGGDDSAVQTTPVRRGSSGLDVPVMPAAPNATAARSTAARPPAAPPAAQPPAPYAPSPAGPASPFAAAGIQTTAPIPPGLYPPPRPELAEGSPPAPAPGPTARGGVPVLAVAVAMMAGVFCVAALVWYVTAR